MGDAFDTRFEDLPQEIPVFPLPRVRSSCRASSFP